MPKTKVNKPAPWAKDPEVAPFTRDEALVKVREIGTHSFLKPKFALALCVAFKVKAPFIGYELANTGEERGLMTASRIRNEKVYGISAWDLLEHIATALGAPYEHKLGRGSRTWAAMTAIEKYEAERLAKAAAARTEVQGEPVEAPRVRAAVDGPGRLRHRPEGATGTGV